MKKHHFTIVVEKDEHGYMAYCPQLQGCHVQGETYEEVLINMEDALRLHVQDRMEAKETWNDSRFINITSLELAL